MGKATGGCVMFEGLSGLYMGVKGLEEGKNNVLNLNGKKGGRKKAQHNFKEKERGMKYFFSERGDIKQIRG